MNDLALALMTFLLILALTGWGETYRTLRNTRRRLLFREQDLLKQFDLLKEARRISVTFEEGVTASYEPRTGLWTFNGPVYPRHMKACSAMATACREADKTDVKE